MDFFVHLLAGNLEDIIHSSFYLSYYAGIQPSEVDKLTTYEFRQYMDLLEEQVKADKERESQVSNLNNLLS